MLKMPYLLLLFFNPMHFAVPGNPSEFVMLLRAALLGSYAGSRRAGNGTSHTYIMHLIMINNASFLCQQLCVSGVM